MGVIAAVAEFERDLLVERTQAGLTRAKAEGKRLGRKPILTESQQVAVRQKLEQGQSVAQAAREFKVTRQIIMRVH